MEYEAPSMTDSKHLGKPQKDMETHNDNSTCSLCPRSCHKNEKGMGYCGSGNEAEVASICLHKGEEPVLSGKKGICNVFFSHCNLQCIYCQNVDISRNNIAKAQPYNSINQVVDRIEEVLETSENVVGFVSPSHRWHFIIPIMDELHRRGRKPTVVYNTNCYDTIDTLKALENYIDVYLPDFKYTDPLLAQRYSQAKDYPTVAEKALKEMYRQKGSTLITDDNEIAISGLIVRHLILPGCTHNSIEVLNTLADISTNINMSLMSQYFPLEGTPLPDELGRHITQEEYDQVVKHFYDLGFHRGWVQDLDLTNTYKPHFEQMEAFEQ